MEIEFPGDNYIQQLINHYEDYFDELINFNLTHLKDETIIQI